MVCLQHLTVWLDLLSFDACDGSGGNKSTAGISLIPVVFSMTMQIIADRWDRWEIQTRANCASFIYLQTDQQLDCALDLMRRLPPQQIEKNLSDLIDLVSIATCWQAAKWARICTLVVYDNISSYNLGSISSILSKTWNTGQVKYLTQSNSQNAIFLSLNVLNLLPGAESVWRLTVLRGSATKDCSG